MIATIITAALCGLAVNAKAPVLPTETVPEEVYVAQTEAETEEKLSAEAEAETEAETEIEALLEYTDEDLWYMERVIQAEAGYTYDDMMYGVASVLYNRKLSSAFPDSIRECVEQPGQYSTASYLSSVEVTPEAHEVAVDVLSHGSRFPGDILFQANFIQGPVYQQLSTSYSTMYFCALR